MTIDPDAVRTDGAPRSHRALVGWILSAAFALVVSAAPRAQIVQLANGDTVLAEVVDADADRLTLRRLDDGGVLELEWADLSKLHQSLIKRRLGIDTGEEVEVTVEAHAIRFRTAGGAVEEVIGLVVGETDTSLQVLRRGTILPVPRRSFNSDTLVQVPWSEVYTDDDWYAKELEAFAPGDDPDAHVRLAENLRRAGLYERSKLHYEKSQELGGGAFAGQLENRLARIQTLIDAKDERELLAEIRRQRFRKRFQNATELIAQFEEQFPDSELKGELAKEQDRLAESQAEALALEVRTNFTNTLSEVAYQIAGDEDLTLERVRDYASERMAGEIFTRIADRIQKRNDGIEIDADQVAALWGQRNEFGQRPYSKFFNYDRGSWVLGEEAVLAGTQASGSSGAGDGAEDDPELERFVRRLREIERRGRAASSANQRDDESPDDWWKTTSRSERQSWLQAYFAEFGGQLEIRRAVAAPCPTCAARGWVESVSSTGEGAKQRKECPTCHGTKYRRALRAR